MSETSEVSGGREEVELIKNGLETKISSGEGTPDTLHSYLKLELEQATLSGNTDETDKYKALLESDPKARAKFCIEKGASIWQRGKSEALMLTSSDPMISPLNRLTLAAESGVQANNWENLGAQLLGKSRDVLLAEGVLQRDSERETSIRMARIAEKKASRMRDPRY